MLAESALDDVDVRLDGGVASGAQRGFFLERGETRLLRLQRQLGGFHGCR